MPGAMGGPTAAPATTTAPAQVGGQPAGAGFRCLLLLHLGTIFLLRIKHIACRQCVQSLLAGLPYGPLLTCATSGFPPPRPR